MNMQLLSAAVFLQDGLSDGLSRSEVFDSLPRDPASIFALALVVGGALAVVWFGRPKGGGTKAT